MKKSLLFLMSFTLLSFCFPYQAHADAVGQLKAQMKRMEESHQKEMGILYAKIEDLSRQMQSIKGARATQKDSTPSGLEERISSLEEQGIEERLERAKSFRIGAWTEIVAEDVGLKSNPDPSWTFDIRNLNIFLDALIADDFRFYSELELRGENLTQNQRDVGLQDTSEFNLERVWLDWNINEYINFRFGKFLTPYGIWNLNHFATKRVSTRDPLLIRREIFPETMTGLRLYGAYTLWDDLIINYTSWFGNGKGGNPDAQDGSQNKSLGGRVSLTFPVLDFGELTLGQSAHIGVDSRTGVDERIWGWDAEFNHGAFRHVVEYNLNNADDVTQPDAGQEFRERGWYYQVEYDFEGLRSLGWDLDKMGVGFLDDAKAFFRYDILHESTVDTRGVTGLAIYDQTNYLTTYGLNYQIRDNIVVKGEWHHHDPRQGGPDHEMIAASVAMSYG